MPGQHQPFNNIWQKAEQGPRDAWRKRLLSSSSQLTF
jgi:hypothetical protein